MVALMPEGDAYWESPVQGVGNLFQVELFWKFLRLGEHMLKV